MTDNPMLDVGVSRKAMSLARLVDRLDDGTHVLVIQKSSTHLQVKVMNEQREYSFWHDAKLSLDNGDN